MRGAYRIQCNLTTPFTYGTMIDHRWHLSELYTEYTYPHRRIPRQDSALSQVRPCNIHPLLFQLYFVVEARDGRTRLVYLFSCINASFRWIYQWRCISVPPSSETSNHLSLHHEAKGNDQRLRFQPEFMNTACRHTKKEGSTREDQGGHETLNTKRKDKHGTRKE